MGGLGIRLPPRVISLLKMLFILIVLDTAFISNFQAIFIITYVEECMITYGGESHVVLYYLEP